MGNTDVDWANKILRNTIIAIPLKCPGNFWRSLEILLINWKFYLKLKWTNHYCVSAAAGVDGDDANLNNIIFTIKKSKLYVPVATLSEKTIKNYKHFLAKDFKDHCIGMNRKQKSKCENATKVYKYFLELKFEVNCLFWLFSVRIMM